MCRWSAELCNRDDSLARYFDVMNEKNALVIDKIQRKCEKVITFSHFVPRLVFKGICSMIGSNRKTRAGGWGGRSGISKIV